MQKSTWYVWNAVPTLISIRKAAVSIYAMEGAYPATYEDLKAQSGIAVDEEKYIVQYEIFASNIMPEITVLDRTVFE